MQKYAKWPTVHKLHPTVFRKEEYIFRDVQKAVVEKIHIYGKVLVGGRNG